MSGNPKHGIKPLAQKERVRALGPSNGTQIYKILARKPGEIAYTLFIRRDSEATRVEEEQRALGMEVIFSRL
jgi:hypothetical protein